MNKNQDVIKHFNRLFAKRHDKVDETIPETELRGYMDPTNVSMIIPLKKGFRDLIKSSFDVREDKIPELNYKQDSKNPDNKCMYSSEYLRVVLELAKHYDNLTLEMKPDSPLRVTTEDFIFILAPRVTHS